MQVVSQPRGESAHAAWPRAVSFAGCAWLLPYHLGAMHVLARRLPLSGVTFLGTSSGAIAAVAFASGLAAHEVFEQTLRSAARFASARLGPLGRMSRVVRHALETMLPQDAHRRVAGRFFAAVTALPSLRARLEPTSPLDSRAELIELVLASCYIPGYYETMPRYRGALLVDGGLRCGLPTLPDATLTVSPLPVHRAHVAPLRAPPYLRMLLPERARLSKLYTEGERAAERYLSSSHIGVHDTRGGDAE